MWEGLKVLLTLPERPPEIVVETDCLDFFRMLMKIEDDLLDSKVCVDAILALAQNQGMLHFKHCPRLQNGVANSITRVGVGLNCSVDFFVSNQGSSSILEDERCFWPPDLLPFLVSSILEDCIDLNGCFSGS